MLRTPKLQLMLTFDRISPPLPQALASALRRLAQLAHTSSWDQWASQRLTPKGLVKKRRSHVDGRALAIMLTADGRRSVTALAALPDPLQAAFAVLTPPEQEAFYRSAIKMIRGLQEIGALPISRMCVRCRYFDPFRYQDSPTPHHCHLVGAPFADRHLRIDCPDSEFNDPEAQQALWVRFTAPAAIAAAAKKDKPAQ
jgi:hypothetical protein